MQPRDSLAVEHDVAIFAAPDGSAGLGQKQSGAFGAQPADEVQAQSTFRRIGRGSAFAKRDGERGVERASEIVFLADHCGFSPNVENVENFVARNASRRPLI